MISESPSFACEGRTYDLRVESLPRVDRVSRLLMRALVYAPARLRGTLARTLCKRIGLAQGTDVQPGFECRSGLISCGEDVGLGDTLFLDYGGVTIGSHVSFSMRNIVLTSSHHFGRFNEVVVRGVAIEDGVWITTNVVVLPGVRIGRNSVIGAGSVVSEDVPPNVLAAGNPCRVVRELAVDERRAGPGGEGGSGRDSLGAGE